MNHIPDMYPATMFKCEFCGHGLDLGDIVQITITRNPLEDHNVITKHHLFCQKCWNKAEISINGKKVK